MSLLLFMLGLEYTGDELRTSIRDTRLGGAVDLVLNFLPGLALALILGWSPLAAVVLGGVTCISSSGIVAKVLEDLNRLGNRETPAVLSILVIEDLAMAAYLPLLAVALAGEGVAGSIVAVLLALGAVGVVLYLALRHGHRAERLLQHGSDEVVLLSVLGLLLVVAAVGELLQFSAAVGAFLVGIALSGPLANKARRLVGPIRDLAAAVFFFLFGVQVDTSALPGVLAPAFALAAIAILTKLVSGWVAARDASVPGRIRAGTALIARGEFSIVIAELGVVAGVESRLGPLAIAFVLITAVAGPPATRLAGNLRVKQRAPGP